MITIHPDQNQKASWLAPRVRDQLRGHVGASARAHVVMHHYGFTVEHVCKQTHDLLRRCPGEIMMRVGIAADHGGFTLKTQMAESLRGSGYEVVDFGPHELSPGDDYPDFIIPLARAVATAEVERGVALCGSGVRHPSPRTKFPACDQGSLVMSSPPTKASKMTT